MTLKDQICSHLVYLKFAFSKAFRIPKSGKSLLQGNKGDDKNAKGPGNSKKQIGACLGLRGGDLRTLP